MGRPRIIFRDFSVTKIEVHTGPSIIKTHYQIREDNKELGNITSCFMIEFANLCEGIFLYDKYPMDIKVGYTLFDCVADIIDTKDIPTVDHVCNLLFQQGLTL